MPAPGAQQPWYLSASRRGAMASAPCRNGGAAATRTALAAAASCAADDKAPAVPSDTSAPPAEKRTRGGTEQRPKTKKRRDTTGTGAIMGGCGVTRAAMRLDESLDLLADDPW